MEAHGDLRNYDNLSVLEKIQLELNSKLEVNMDLVKQQEDEECPHEFNKVRKPI